MKPLYLFLAILMVGCGGDKESQIREATLLAENDSLRAIIEMGQIARHRTGLKLTPYRENDTIKYHVDSLLAPIETLVVYDTVRVEYAVPLGWYEERLSFEHTFLKFYGADSLVFQVVRLNGRPLSMNLNYLGYQYQPSNPKREPR